MPFDLTNWMMVFARAGALLTLFPVFGAQNFPIQLRVALGALIAFLIAPTLPPVAVEGLHLFGLVGWLAMEVGIGLLLGFISRMIFYALEFAGGIVAMEMGLNMAAAFNPFNSDRSEAIALMLYYLGIMLLLTLNLHHWVLLGFQKSYTLLPVGGGHLTAALFTDIVQRTSQVFQVGVLMAGPMIAVSFVITLVFSVLGRAVPQMSVFPESFAFRTLAGLILFGLTLHLTAQHVANALRRLPDDILLVAKLLSSS
jgi:flagellar biosynthetic protein FliR